MNILKRKLLIDFIDIKSDAHENAHERLQRFFSTFRQIILTVLPGNILKYLPLNIIFYETFQLRF